jgi:hypothetical protein
LASAVATVGWWRQGFFQPIDARGFFLNVGDFCIDQLNGGL